MTARRTITIADNDLSGLQHGGVYIFRNCGQSTSAYSKAVNNAIDNNRFYYDEFDNDPESIVLSR